MTASKDKSEEATEDGTNRRKTRDTKKEYSPHHGHQPLEGGEPSSDDLSQKLGGLSGRLSEELVKQGLLSEDMLEKLQAEWKEASRKSRLDFDRDGFNEGSRSEGAGRTGSSTKRKQTKRKK